MTHARDHPKVTRLTQWSVTHRPTACSRRSPQRHQYAWASAIRQSSSAFTQITLCQTTDRPHMHNVRMDVRQKTFTCHVIQLTNRVLEGVTAPPSVIFDKSWRDIATHVR